MRKISTMLAVLASVTFLALPLYAGVAGPASVKGSRPTERAINMGKIERVVLSKKVSARLEELGYAPAKIVENLPQLTDDELSEAAAKLDTLQAGGDASIGTLFLSIILVCVLVALIYWLIIILVALFVVKAIATKVEPPETEQLSPATTPR